MLQRREASPPRSSVVPSSARSPAFQAGSEVRPSGGLTVGRQSEGFPLDSRQPIRLTLTCWAQFCSIAFGGTDVSEELREPGEADSIDCHLQQIAMGTLICKAARQVGDDTTNEVTPAVCFSCDVGRIYREVGCDAVVPKIRFFPSRGGPEASLEALFCKIRKRPTTLEFQ